MSSPTPAKKLDKLILFSHDREDRYTTHRRCATARRRDDADAGAARQIGEQGGERLLERLEVGERARRPVRRGVGVCAQIDASKRDVCCARTARDVTKRERDVTRANIVDDDAPLVDDVAKLRRVALVDDRGELRLGDERAPDKGGVAERHRVERQQTSQQVAERLVRKAKRRERGKWRQRGDRQRRQAEQTRRAARLLLLLLLLLAEALERQHATPGDERGWRRASTKQASGERDARRRR